MKTFLKTKAGPVAAGLVVAFSIMMAFEYANSFYYPLPADLDMSDTEGLRAYTASLPWTAYILVLLGWVVGSFAAGALTTYISKEVVYKLSYIVGIILTLLGVLNNMLIGHDMFFNIIGLPMFIIFTYLGHRFLRSRLA